MTSIYVHQRSVLHTKELDLNIHEQMFARNTKIEMIAK